MTVLTITVRTDEHFIDDRFADDRCTDDCYESEFDYLSFPTVRDTAGSPSVRHPASGAVRQP